MERSAKIYIAGHNGLVGSALLRVLLSQDYRNIITRTHKDLDLIRQEQVESFFKKEKPDYVFLAAAKVGGIQANISHPAEFIYENCTMQNNVIHSAYISGAKKLLFFGSSCMYPKECLQPMKEEYLLSGKLEPTNEPYAIAKLAGMKMCKAYNKQYKANFICLISSNIYGVGDHFGSKDSHVIPALLDKFHKAKVENLPSVTVWGTGNPRREFIFVDDVAEAAIFLMNNYNNSEFINIGSGKDISIKDLATTIKRVVGYKGEIVFDTSKPEGILRKLLDISNLDFLGQSTKISLEEGLDRSYKWFCESCVKSRTH